MSGRKVIAIDLGGTRIRAALFIGAELAARDALATDVTGGPDAIFGQIDRLIDTVCGGARPADLAAIGMSCAGPINTASGIVTSIPTLPGWDGVPLARMLAARTGLPARVENDGIAATLGEWRHGAGQGVRNMIYLTVSTGIGGGGVVDGRLLHGHKGMAGHIGHIGLVQDGPRCHCGATGCFEALASGSALEQRARAAAADNGSSCLGPPERAGDIRASHVFEGARAGDALCRRLVAEEAAWLGQGVTSAIHMFSPERVVIGGGLSNGFDLLEDGIRAVIQRDAMPSFRAVQLRRAALGDDSGLWGAASMLLEPDGDWPPSDLNSGDAGVSSLP